MLLIMHLVMTGTYLKVTFYMINKERLDKFKKITDICHRLIFSVSSFSCDIYGSRLSFKSIDMFCNIFYTFNLNNS